MEVSLVSAIDLHDGGFSAGLPRMSPCAVVSLDQLDLRQTSKVAADGLTHPVWHESFRSYRTPKILPASTPPPSTSTPRR